jgi:hypothetical protein
VMPFWGRWWDAEHGFASVVLCVQCDVARRGGLFSAVAPPSVRETLSWLEHSPSMLQLQWGRTGPPCCTTWRKGGRSFFPARRSENSSVESLIVARCVVDAPLRVEPTKMAPSLPLIGDRLWPQKYSVMNSKFPRRTGLPRENPPHARRSPSVVMAIEDDGTIRMSRGVARCKSSFLACQLSVFFCTSKI